MKSINAKNIRYRNKNEEKDSFGIFCHIFNSKFFKKWWVSKSCFITFSFQDNVTKFKKYLLTHLNHLRKHSICLSLSTKNKRQKLFSI